MNKKIRWGILSTANIGMKQVIPAMMKGSNCEMAAIASRNKKKAEEAAAELGIAKAYGSYEELLSDSEIDAIYNPLPNHLHVEWSIRCMEAGKHVLCEKPIALTVEDVEKLMEARFNGAKGQAFTDTYGNYRGRLADIALLDRAV